MVQLNINNFINFKINKTSNPDDARLVLNHFNDWDTRIMVDIPDLSADDLLEPIQDLFAPQFRALENYNFHQTFALKKITLNLLNNTTYVWMMHWTLIKKTTSLSISGITYLEQEEGQPKPMYTYYLGDLYIVQIALA